MSRANKDILKDLCSFDVQASNPMDRLPHDCYMILVGRLKNKDHMKLLLNMNNSQGISSTEIEDEQQAEFAVLNSEEVEFVLEHIVLEGRTDSLENQRKGYIVYEDNFNSSLANMMRSGASYDKLKQVCRRYETKDNVNVNKIMKEHDDRVKLSHSFFLEKNLPETEAKALAFALSFYTGTKSEACSRGASLIARKSNGVLIEAETEAEIKEAAIIMFYLVKALSYIPYHWGYVTRACQLTFDELQIYMPGCLITWIQFSSSKKGKKGLKTDAFKDRNTLFKIFSLTGRPIKQFSNYPEEDEVLFLPHSTFLVFNRKLYASQGKQVIYMRQVELGLCKWCVLWVDDHIYDQKWENKKHMEYAAVKALDMNVHFIPKSNTDAALSFLRSPFGERLKNQDNFRIVTDMHRDNEHPAHNAGTRLIKAIRQMGFKNKCLIFVYKTEETQEILRSELNSREQQSVSVSNETQDLRDFVNFDQKPIGAQMATYANEDHAYASNSSTASAYQINDDDDDSDNIHNQMNTNLDLIIRNCKMRKLSNNRHNCVLLTTGAFNPPQPYHFRNLLRVKEYLENEHEPSWNVLGGYLSPTHDAYVRSKLGDSAWIPANERCRQCQDMINSGGSNMSSWIGVSHGESKWSGGFVDFVPVTENFRDFLNNTLVDQQQIFKYPIRVVYVCRLDLFDRCPYLENLANQNNMACAVLYRKGYDEDQISSTNAPGVIYIPLMNYD